MLRFLPMFVEITSMLENNGKLPNQKILKAYFNKYTTAFLGGWFTINIYGILFVYMEVLVINTIYIFSLLVLRETNQSHCYL